MDSEENQCTLWTSLLLFVVCCFCDSDCNSFFHYLKLLFSLRSLPYSKYIPGETRFRKKTMHGLLKEIFLEFHCQFYRTRIRSLRIQKIRINYIRRYEDDKFLVGVLYIKELLELHDKPHIPLFIKSSLSLPLERACDKY